MFLPARPRRATLPGRIRGAQIVLHAKDAEAGPEGLLAVHKKLTLAGKDTEYGRELEKYLSKLVNPVTGSLET